jgi:hypothetical protein
MTAPDLPTGPGRPATAVPTGLPVAVHAHVAALVGSLASGDDTELYTHVLRVMTLNLLAVEVATVADPHLRLAVRGATIAALDLLNVWEIAPGEHTFAGLLPATTAAVAGLCTEAAEVADGLLATGWTGSFTDLLSTARHLVH